VLLWDLCGWPASALAATAAAAAAVADSSTSCQARSTSSLVTVAITADGGRAVKSQSVGNSLAWPLFHVRHLQALARFWLHLLNRRQQPANMLPPLCIQAFPAHPLQQRQRVQWYWQQCRQPGLLGAAQCWLAWGRALWRLPALAAAVGGCCGLSLLLLLLL